MLGALFTDPALDQRLLGTLTLKLVFQIDLLKVALLCQAGQLCHGRNHSPLIKTVIIERVPKLPALPLQLGPLRLQRLHQAARPQSPVLRPPLP
jgi:hypothetical protein